MGLVSFTNVGGRGGGKTKMDEYARDDMGKGKGKGKGERKGWQVVWRSICNDIGIRIYN